MTKYFEEMKIQGRDEWAGLNAIGMVRSTSIVDETESIEHRYFIIYSCFRKLQESIEELRIICTGVLI